MNAIQSPLKHIASKSGRPLLVPDAHVRDKVKIGHSRNGGAVRTKGGEGEGEEGEGEEAEHKAIHFVKEKV